MDRWKIIVYSFFVFLIIFFWFAKLEWPTYTDQSDENRVAIYCDNMESIYWTYIDYDSMSDVDYALSECQAYKKTVDICLKEPVSSEWWERCTAHHNMNVHNILNLMK